MGTVIDDIRGPAHEGLGTALWSLDPTSIMVDVDVRFQQESTALIVAMNGTPAYWFTGLPVLPKPGTAVSPGASTCNPL